MPLKVCCSNHLKVRKFPNLLQNFCSSQNLRLAISKNWSITFNIITLMLSHTSITFWFMSIYLVNFGRFPSLIVEERMLQSYLIYLVHFGPFLFLSSGRECLYTESTACDSASHKHVSLRDPHQLSGNNVLRWVIVPSFCRTRYQFLSYSPYSFHC